MKNIKKIGVLIDKLRVNGVEKIAIEEVRALIAEGENAYLVVLRKSKGYEKVYSDLRKGLPTIFLDDRLSLFFKFSFKFPIFYYFSLFHLTYPFLIPWVFKKNEFDYLIVHSTYTALTAIGLKWTRGISFSVFIWDPISYILSRVYSKNFVNIFFKILIFFAGCLDSFIINNSDVVLVGGDAHNNFFKNKKSDVKIKIITPSVHLSKNLAKVKNEYVLMVTGWTKPKSPEYIFEIVRKIPELKIKMVGKWLDPQFRISFEDNLNKNGLTKNIEVVGEVSEKVLGEYYSKALVLLQTNDDKGFGMPALEAASCGTTFIVPKGQGVCNHFINEVDGFYTNEKDTEAIIDYLSLLMKNNKLAMRMGIHAFNSVGENYTWKNHARSLINIVEANLNK